MNTLILYIDRHSEWMPQNWIISLGGGNVCENQFNLEIGGELISVIPSVQVLSDLEEEELLKLHKIVAEPNAFIIEWRGNGLIEKFLESIPNNASVAVDNDHGLMVSVRDVLGKPLNSWIYSRNFLN